MSHSDSSVEVPTSPPVPATIVDSSIHQWLLVEANRWGLASVLSIGVFGVFFALGRAGLIGVAAVGPTTLLLSVLIAGNVTLVTITITINQLVLSREFGRPHDLGERNEGIRQLRVALKEVADVPVIPPAPKAFIRVLAETMDECADAVEETVAGSDDEEFRRQVDLFRKQVSADTDRVVEELEMADFGSYELVSVMLRMNTGWLIGTTERLEWEKDDALPDEPFDRMQDALELFNITRQYTKTLYVQKEIATLSRLLLYVSLVATILLSAGMVSYGVPLSSIVSPTVLLAAFSVTSAIAFAPLSFLLSYMLRLSTIVSYTPLRNSFITDG